jgi:hypothetical protein
VNRFELRGAIWTKRYLVRMTYEELLEIARAAEGQTLETVTGRKFTVGTYRDGLFFTPASSGWGQSEGRPGHERFLQRYNASGSLRPADYSGVSRNASYLIGLLLWAQSRGHSDR